eukprot:CAMPEP_0172751854 /NCGR_PEP_ID=MMETSP1074-20121228/152664_1 /TAXON_ID=2916 /ORGANISM="Ceratium fusus, Strain PA161109" /LENGTH=59 /DNA_ID=CAMNT_0013584271 /DNA_START=262 /DNA_END=441 /DNA_ORIENTATION=+
MALLKIHLQDFHGDQALPESRALMQIRPIGRRDEEPGPRKDPHGSGLSQSNSPTAPAQH